MALQTRRRTESPARWLAAAERAQVEDIRVAQLENTGQWIAVSRSSAYEFEVVGNLAGNCTCMAGLNGDPCCKHVAGWYVAIGALGLTVDPEPPAPRASASWAHCPSCAGEGGFADHDNPRIFTACFVCLGSGLADAA